MTLRSSFSKNASIARFARLLGAASIAAILNAHAAPAFELNGQGTKGLNGEDISSTTSTIYRGTSNLPRKRLDSPTAFDRFGLPAPVEVHYTGPKSAGSILLDDKNQYLYVVLPNKRAIKYIVAVGREALAIKTADHYVYEKVTNPEWYTKTETLYGPASPLGVLGLYLANAKTNEDETYAIHGTNAPQKLLLPDGQRRLSHGCIRMNNNDITDLFGRVSQNATVTVYFKDELKAQTAPLGDAAPSVKIQANQVVAPGVRPLKP